VRLLASVESAIAVAAVSKKAKLSHGKLKLRLGTILCESQQGTLMLRRLLKGKAPLPE
jgi:hypothetical protein